MQKSKVMGAISECTISNSFSANLLLILVAGSALHEGDYGLYEFVPHGISTASWYKHCGGCKTRINCTEVVVETKHVTCVQTRLQEFDNPLSVRVRSLIKVIRAERRRHMKV